MKNCWLEIDYNQIKTNLKIIKDYVGDTKKLICVVKNNSYGHDLIDTAVALLEAGADMLAVVKMDSAVKLRNSGIKHPILLISPFDKSQLSEAIDNDIILSVTDDDFPEVFTSLKNEIKNRLKLQIQINTGMNRHGISPYKLHDIFHYIMNHDKLDLTGIYSNSSSTTTAEAEYKLFISSLSSLEGLPSKLLCHFGNSASILKFPLTILDGARFGILSFGIFPHDDVPVNLAIRPAVSWKARVNSIRTVKAGDNIGYMGKFEITKDTKIAIVSTGYGYGYLRKFINGEGTVLINGKKCKLASPPNMNDIMVILDDNNCKVGDEVVLLGKQKNEEITIYELAKRLDTIEAEVLCLMQQTTEIIRK